MDPSRNSMNMDFAQHLICFNLWVCFSSGFFQLGELLFTHESGRMVRPSFIFVGAHDSQLVFGNIIRPDNVFMVVLCWVTEARQF